MFYFFSLYSGILLLIQKVRFLLSSPGKDLFMYCWMERNPQFAILAMFCKAVQSSFWKKQGALDYKYCNIRITKTINHTLTYHGVFNGCDLQVNFQREGGEDRLHHTKLLHVAYVYVSLTHNYQWLIITFVSCEIRCCQTDQSHTKLSHLPLWHLEGGQSFVIKCSSYLGLSARILSTIVTLHLFDELLALLFFLFNTAFRGGDFNQWLVVLLWISLMFITFRRRNYDKATLC